MRLSSARPIVPANVPSYAPQRGTAGNGQGATGNEKDEWPIEDLVGCEIEGVGKVTGVLEGMSCDVLEVGDELIPLVTDAVTGVDVENKVIQVNREFLGL